MKIQYISDIHLEHWDILEIDRIIPFINTIHLKTPSDQTILVLAGDIGSLTAKNTFLSSFINYAVEHWDYVFYVAGNHEYYNKRSTRTKITEKLRSLTRTRSNLFFLDRDIVEVDGVRFLGCTLWSNPISKDGFSDYKHIYYQKTNTERKPISLTILAGWHEADREWLREIIQDGDIVITHFMPALTSDLIEAGHCSKYPSSPIDDMYYGNNDMMEIMNRATLWISGHTHQKFDVLIGDNLCRWVCNPLGYPGEHSL